MMFANDYFKPYWGEFRIQGSYSTVGLPLSEADADSATAVTKPGRLVALDHANMKLVYSTAKMYGILFEQVSLNGVLTDFWRQTWQQTYAGQQITASKNPSLRRGAMAGIAVYEPNALLEFEGLGAASVDNNVITATTTGFLASNTTLNTPLTCEKGGWRAAQAGELAFALLEAILTPNITGNLRIMVRMISPIVKA